MASKHKPKDYPYKDCPFCGGPALGSQCVVGKPGYWVNCIECGAEMRAGSVKVLMRRWNRRVSDTSTAEHGK